uniref:Low density lipoprotein receptor adaptor protein 1 n=1 Tax=Anolis carolinensis TaxID=28377 RepID=A0A803THZ5_ANOCA
MDGYLFSPHFPSVAKPSPGKLHSFWISYCTADKVHDKVFAYIAQSQHNENLECHAFLCGKKKMAQAVTLTVAQAFKVAFEFWQASKEGESVTTGNLLDLENAVKPPLTVNTNSVHLDSSVFRPRSSDNNNVVWCQNMLSEAFMAGITGLAESRTNPQDLDIGLTAQDLQSAEILSPVDWEKADAVRAGEKDDHLFGF